MTHRLEGKRDLRQRWRGTAAVGLLALLAAGCTAFRPPNQPLEHWDPDYGYRPTNVQARRPIGDVLLVLAFSGGGTRAAAFAYGVLQELRDTQVIVDGQEKRLLDEVDLITSVSGGSFTAAYYGLFGDRIFVDFEQRFLRRNIERRLILEIFRPLNWFRLASSFFDRTELAVRLYDRDIFDRSTFADLQAAGGPLLQINAADLSIGNRFTFFQPQFDLICSDLSTFKVARAVAASSAVPGVFSAITLRNYANDCGFIMPDWIEAAINDRRSARRRRYAKVLKSYVDGDRRYIHLVDGGIADNLGLRGPLDNVILSGGLSDRFAQIGTVQPSHVAVIAVNAEVHPQPLFSLSPASPSLFAILDAVSGTQIYSYNFETLELMRTSLQQWARALPPTAEGQPVQAYMPELAFESLDPSERDFFNNVPTSFSLPDATVDRLIGAGRQMLRNSPEYQQLVASLHGHTVEEQPPPAAPAAPR